MSTRKRNRQKKKILKKGISQTTLHVIVFAVELVLLFLLLSILITDMYGKTSTKPVMETAETVVRTLPDDVKNKMSSDVVSSQLRVPILMYHYVENVTDTKDTFRASLNIEPIVFEEQIITLKNSGYTFMTASELADVFDGYAILPEKPILITIDDGHWDIYTDVLSKLKKHQVKITAYIIPGLVGGSDFLTKEQLHIVARSGLVDIGAHTVHHLSLPNLSTPEMEYEIKESKKILEDELGVTVSSFAYPNGAFNVQIADTVEDSQFRIALSTIPGIEHSEESRYFLYRLRPGKRVGDELLNWLNQDYFQAFQ